MNLSSANLFEQSLFLAQASQVAYAANPDSDPLWPALRLTNEFPFGDARTDTNGYVARADDHIVVALRGTSTLANLSTDLDIAYTSAFGGSVHRGFREAAQTVFDVVRTGIAAQTPMPADRIWITGHSLGGALAILLGELFDSSPITVAARTVLAPAVVTFGAPKVGDATFVANCPIKQRLVQFANDNDPVPYTPPFEGWNYQPLKPHYKIFPTGYFKYLNMSSATLRNDFLEKIKTFWFQLKSIILGSKHSHGIATYVNNLRALITAGRVIRAL